MNFIKTKDIETKNKLLDAGFTLFSEKGNLYVFLNDGKVNFAEEKGLKMTYSNRMSV